VALGWGFPTVPTYAMIIGSTRIIITVKASEEQEMSDYEDTMLLIKTTKIKKEKNKWT
jgi:hypothetical protein